jgi:hypothetical protein
MRMHTGYDEREDWEFDWVRREGLTGKPVLTKSYPYSLPTTTFSAEWNKRLLWKTWDMGVQELCIMADWQWASWTSSGLL